MLIICCTIILPTFVVIEPFLIAPRSVLTAFLSFSSPDEGVYVDTNGKLVRHAILQWGEAPYAIGKYCWSQVTLDWEDQFLLGDVSL